jgi:hypothetical protein
MRGWRRWAAYRAIGFPVVSENIVAPISEALFDRQGSAVLRSRRHRAHEVDPWQVMVCVVVPNTTPWAASVSSIPITGEWKNTDFASKIQR